MIETEKEVEVTEERISELEPQSGEVEEPEASPAEVEEPEASREPAAEEEPEAVASGQDVEFSSLPILGRFRYEGHIYTRRRGNRGLSEKGNKLITLPPDTIVKTA